VTVRCIILDFCTSATAARLPFRVKNGPDTLEMGFLFYHPRADIGQLRCRLRCHRLQRCSDAREAVKALIVANHYLETDLEKLKAAASMGYARGKLFEEVPRDRKDWYD
jgi:hypothetical protein